MTTDTTKLQVKDLNFYYGGFHALKNINLSIASKKVTAFIGPSGCGKSTLLRIFNRMYELYPGLRAEGQIVMDGKNILDKDVDINLLRAKVGMVFQKPTPFPMSIYDNVTFGVKLYEKLSKSEMDDRVEWALRKAALWEEVKDKLKQSGHSLSGGQQQRVAIARAIAGRPSLILADEPTANLDSKTAQDIIDLFKQLNADFKLTFIFSTHDQRLIDQVKRVIRIKDGQLQEGN